MSGSSSWGRGSNGRPVDGRFDSRCVDRSRPIVRAAPCQSPGVSRYAGPPNGSRDQRASATVEPDGGGRRVRRTCVRTRVGGGPAVLVRTPGVTVTDSCALPDLADSSGDQLPRLPIIGFVYSRLCPPRDTSFRDVTLSPAHGTLLLLSEGAIRPPERLVDRSVDGLQTKPRPGCSKPCRLAPLPEPLFLVRPSAYPSLGRPFYGG